MYLNIFLGTVTMESQGQELCHEYFVESGICDPKRCADQCTYCQVERIWQVF